MKTCLSIAMVMIMAATVASAQDAKTEPRFKAPEPAQMLRLYPKEARKAGLGADVIIGCAWSEKGRLTCHVLRETPEGQGFGEATVKGFEAHGRALDVDAASAPDQEKKFRFRWTTK